MSSSTSSETTSRPIGRDEIKRPIVEIRALNYRWAEVDPDNPTNAIQLAAYRVEIRREGEVEWTEIPVIEMTGKPPG